MRRPRSWRAAVAGAVLGTVLALARPAHATDEYRIAYATYLGGAKWEQARDVAVDGEGNAYVVGCVTSSEKEGFPVTSGAWMTTFTASGTAVGALGAASGFVGKFSAEGGLLWLTYLGGPNYDRIYSAELAPDGNLVVCGRGGPGFPTTPGSVQPEWMGDPTKAGQGEYGAQNAFVAKLSADGKRLLWSTHLGTGEMCRSMAVDDAGNVYVAVGRDNASTPPPAEPAWAAEAFAHAYAPKPSGGPNDLAVVKVSADGARVLWATWLCGSGEEKPEACVRVDAAHNVYVAMTTNSTDMPVTGCYDDTPNGGFDAYYAKLSPDGSRLLYGTYLGGRGADQGNETHSLFVDAAGFAYAVVRTDSPDFPVTRDQGVYDNGRRGKSNQGIVKLSPEGHLLLAALLGTSGAEKSEGMTVDAATGAVVVGGLTSSADFPTTEHALQKGPSGSGLDAFVVRLAPDFRSLEYATCIGGAGDQSVRALRVDARGAIYAVGSTTGDWPTVRAVQDRYAGSNDTRWVNGDAVVMKLVPAPRGN